MYRLTTVFELLYPGNMLSKNSEDPAFSSEMSRPGSWKAQESLSFVNTLRKEYHDEGLRSTLENLTQFIEVQTG